MLDMNEEFKKYSDDTLLNTAIKLIKNGKTYEEVQSKYKLSDADMELIDFVINEF